jgi:List-Bact-rpt repeat protein
MGRVLFLRLIVATAAVGALTSVAGASVSRPTLRVSTDGHGAVASRDGRIHCGLRCSARYRRGAVVSLGTTPETLFAFDHWSGGCVGTASRCFVSLYAARAVKATFARRSVTLSLSVSGPGTVTSDSGGIVCGRAGESCSATFPAGTAVTLTAAPEASGLFGRWSDPCGSGAECTVIIDRDLNLLTAFAHVDPDPDQPLLTVVPDGSHVTSDPPGIDCPPTCQAEFPSGTLVTLHGDITKWNGLCVGVARECAIILDNSDGTGTGGPPPPPQLGVNVSVSGPGMVTARGGIRCGRTTLFDCQHLYPQGSTVVLRATPGRRGRFVFWSGFCTGRKRTCQVRVTAPKTIQALFRR